MTYDPWQKPRPAAELARPFLDSAQPNLRAMALAWLTIEERIDELRAVRRPFTAAELVELRALLHRAIEAGTFLVNHESGNNE